MLTKLRVEVLILHIWIWSASCIVLPEPGLSPVMSSYSAHNDSPEGYFAFIESAKAEPPTVRPPPYFKSKQMCPGLLSGGKNQILLNLCGDLNKGVIPANPMRQSIFGSPYPFDLLKNKTLEFFSKTLPILKADETLPKVAKYHAEPDQFYYQQYHHPTTNIKPPKPRLKREAPTHTDTTTESKSLKDIHQPRPNSKPVFTSGRDIITTILDQIEITRTGKRFCETGGGIMCMLYRVFQGRPLGAGTIERRDDDLDYKKRDNLLMEGPPTPCPAKVEYATPVFARNYQGVWRYVVQIPYEGYFTQTLEVTKCLQTKCFYMEGGCLSSPRWASLLVAEIFYPDTFLPPVPSTKLGHRPPVMGDEPPSIQDFQNYQSYLQKRAGKPSTEGEPGAANASKKSHCDGVDDLGCFQVRLYYDWFLVPGSCKCWRPDYFSRYIRRKGEL